MFRVNAKRLEKTNGEPHRYHPHHPRQDRRSTCVIRILRHRQIGFAGLIRADVPQHRRALGDDSTVAGPIDNGFTGCLIGQRDLAIHQRGMFVKFIGEAVFAARDTVLTAEYREIRAADVEAARASDRKVGTGFRKNPMLQQGVRAKCTISILRILL